MLSVLGVGEWLQDSSRSRAATASRTSSSCTGSPTSPPPARPAAGRSRSPRACCTTPRRASSTARSRTSSRDARGARAHVARGAAAPVARPRRRAVEARRAQLPRPAPAQQLARPSSSTPTAGCATAGEHRQRSVDPAARAVVAAARARGRRRRRAACSTSAPRWPDSSFGDGWAWIAPGEMAGGARPPPRAPRRPAPGVAAATRARAAGPGRDLPDRRRARRRLPCAAVAAAVWQRRCARSTRSRRPRPGRAGGDLRPLDRSAARRRAGSRSGLRTAGGSRPNGTSRVLVVAPTQSGKTTGLAIPAILDWARAGRSRPASRPTSSATRSRTARRLGRTLGLRPDRLHRPRRDRVVDAARAVPRLARRAADRRLDDRRRSAEQAWPERRRLLVLGRGEAARAAALRGRDRPAARWTRSSLDRPPGGGRRARRAQVRRPPGRDRRHGGDLGARRAPALVGLHDRRDRARGLRRPGRARARRAARHRRPTRSSTAAATRCTSARARGTSGGCGRCS